MAVTKGLHAHVVPFFVPAGILRAANETEMSVVEDSNIMTAQTNQIKSRLIYVRLDGLPVAVAQPCHRDECHVEEPVTGETFFQVVDTLVRHISQLALNVIVSTQPPLLLK
jgi:hypothetical protein